MYKNNDVICRRDELESIEYGEKILTELINKQNIDHYIKLVQKRGENMLSF